MKIVTICVRLKWCTATSLLRWYWEHDAFENDSFEFPIISLKVICIRENTWLQGKFNIIRNQYRFLHFKGPWGNGLIPGPLIPTMKRSKTVNSSDFKQFFCSVPMKMLWTASPCTNDHVSTSFTRHFHSI